MRRRILSHRSDQQCPDGADGGGAEPQQHADAGGVDCEVQTDAYLQLTEMALSGPEDVVTAVSQSGTSVNPALTLKEARRNGASTICIPANAQSPSQNVPISP